MAKDKSKRTVAIIGLGNIGKVIAKNLVKNNRSVIVATRQFEKAKELALELGALAKAQEIPQAIKEADIIIMSVWFNTIKEMFSKYGKELEGKIIIDPSNPIGVDDKGGFIKIIGEKESAGQILSGLLPNNAKLVKALGTLGAASLENISGQRPDQAVLFYATNQNETIVDIEELIRDNGFEPLGVGGIEQSIRIEVFGDLHEFGALGKTVTLSEAGEKVYSKVN